jgi:hypothetical protein
VDLNLRKKLVNCSIWIIAVCGSETETVWKVDLTQKVLNAVMDKDGSCHRTDHVRNEELLQGVKEERNILHTEKRKAN